ncbi:MAG: mercuric reductase [Anaerolineae bacterium]|nr:mercuric reductase [Gemmatimonadaceae bacterium]
MAVGAGRKYGDIQPLDSFNRELLAHVHPSGWTNPRARERYHLVVVGAGTAGRVCASAAAGLGASVALVERHLMGGDCLNVGCVPSKALIRAARSWHAARESAASFGGPAATGDGDFGAVMQRMRSLRAAISQIDGAPRYTTLGVDVFFGDARFTSAKSIEVEGQTLRFRRAVVATGARAAVPEAPGLAEAGYRTNETIFELTTLPKRLLVVGAGPIGCELAQAFARFGSAVTVLNRAARILPRDDADAAAIVERAMMRDGVTFQHNAVLKSVELNGGDKVVRFERKGASHSAPCDEILIAAGRAPNVEGLGLESAGIAYGERGVTADDSLRTTNARVFAAGDIASSYQFTHMADAHARIVITNALFPGRSRASKLVVPWTTYTSPEVAHTGVTAEDVAASRQAVDTFTTPLHDVDRARLDGEDEGFLRVYLKKGTDKILGATLVAEHAGDMISEITLAISSGLGLGKVGAAIHPYPTQAEVFRKTADSWRRTKLTQRIKKLLSAYFRWVR